jgi:glycosyltransferase involved in cell wall biosynthesis
MGQTTNDEGVLPLDTLSVVVPCYNEAAALPLFYAEICRVAARMADVRFEFVFVDDGSSDRTLDLLRNCRKTDGRVRYLSFSRNFGKEAALLAGLRAARGRFVAVMDADLQDPPELLLTMRDALVNEGYDCAAARRVSRSGEPRLRSCLARLFYRLMGRIARTDMVDGARDFRLMSRRVVEAILSMPETNRFSKGIFGWVGFQTKWLPYEHVPRAGGDTKWPFFKLFQYALSGITAFSQLPLALASLLGVALFFVSLLILAFLVVRRLAFGDPVSGWASTVCIIIFIGSMQFLCLGIMGQYLSRTYLEVKRRPLYFIRETEEDGGGRAADDGREDGGPAPPAG